MDWIAFDLFLIWIALLCINGNLIALTRAVKNLAQAEGRAAARGRDEG
jgi:hypothetical protein